jgi:hypothetical protein
VSAVGPHRDERRSGDVGRGDVEHDRVGADGHLGLADDVEPDSVRRRRCSMSDWVGIPRLPPQWIVGGIAELERARERLSEI